MLELDRVIDAAIAGAPGPEIARVHQRVHARVARRRVRRRAAWSAIGIALVVGVGGVALRDRPSSTTHVSTDVNNGSTTSSRPQSPRVTSVADLRGALESKGHAVRFATERDTSAMFGVFPTTLCVDRAESVRVYEYGSVDARAKISEGISGDGSTVTDGNQIRSVRWIAAPHFYARGRLLVLYVGEESTLVADLTSVLGPTIDPAAVVGRAGGSKRPC